MEWKLETEYLKKSYSNEEYDVIRIFINKLNIDNENNNIYDMYFKYNKDLKNLLIFFDETLEEKILSFSNKLNEIIGMVVKLILSNIKPIKITYDIEKFYNDYLNDINELDLNDFKTFDLETNNLTYSLEIKDLETNNLTYSLEIKDLETNNLKTDNLEINDLKINDLEINDLKNNILNLKLVKMFNEQNITNSDDIFTKIKNIWSCDIKSNDNDDDDLDEFLNYKINNKFLEITLLNLDNLKKYKDIINVLFYKDIYEMILKIIFNNLDKINTYDKLNIKIINDENNDNNENNITFNEKTYIIISFLSKKWRFDYNNYRQIKDFLSNFINYLEKV